MEDDSNEQDVDDPEVHLPEVQQPEADPTGSDLTVGEEMVLSSSQSLQQTHSEANVSFMLKVRPENLNICGVVFKLE